MSPRRRRIARRDAPLDEGELEHLGTGAADFAGEGFATIETAREAWRIHGRDVIDELTEKYPKGKLWAVEMFGDPRRPTKLRVLKKPGGGK